MTFLSLFDQLYFRDSAVPLSFFLPDETVYVVLFVATYATVISITKVLLDNCKSEAYFALVLGIGYGFGRIIRNMDTEHSYDKPTDFFSHHQIYLCQAIYIYAMTYGVDYHSVARNLTLILSLSVFSTATTMLAVVCLGYPILHRGQGWPWDDVFLFACTILPVEVDATMKQLNLAYGQLRSMEQVLLGERIITLIITSLCYSGARRTAVTALYMDVDRNTSVLITLINVFWMVFGAISIACFAFFASFLLKQTVDHVSKQVLLTVVFPVVVILYAHFMWFSISTFYVLCLGIYLNSVRPKADPNLESFVFQVWEFLTNLVKLVMYTLSGALLGMSNDPNKTVGDMGVALLFVLMLIFFRTVVHFGIYTTVIINSSQMVSWRQAFLSTWGAYCGLNNLFYAVKSYYFHLSYSRHLLYAVIIVLYSKFFNAVLMSFIFSLAGMYDLTKTRIANMNNGLFKINNCRINAIFALKLNRIISDSNWLVVEQLTRIPHPYKRTIKSMGGELDLGDYKVRTITCENCGLTVLAPPSKKELEDLIYEAKLRILKAIMVMLTKQYENGTLSLNCLRILINLTETATLQADPVVEPSDLKITRIGTLTQLRMKNIFDWLYDAMRIAHDFIPKNKFRYICYTLCMSQTFQIIMVVFTLLDVIITLHLLVEFSKDFKTISLDESVVNFIQTAGIFFYALFAMEFVIQILGIGAVQYFRDNINKIEFGTNIIVRSCEVIVYLSKCRHSGHCSLLSFGMQDLQFIMFMKYFLIFRMTRFYIFLAALIPRIRRMIDRDVHEYVQKSYDMGKAYLMALDRVSKSLSHIVESQPAYEVLKKKLEEDRLAVTKELGQIQREFPAIAATIKTRHAIRHVINTMESCIDDMKEEGVLDHNEHKCVVRAIEDLKIPLRNLDSVSPCPPDFIIKSITWLQNDPEAFNFLLNNAELLNFDYNDVIIQQGDDPVGLYVLVSGLVRNIYKPTPTVVQLSSKFGVLPNYDFFTNLNFDQQQEELIGAGNLIGEIGIVTGRRYDMTTICDTSTQVYFMPLAAIKETLFETELGARLRGRIWKSIGMRLAELLFRSNPQHAIDWSKDKLFVYLERSFVPDLNGITRINFKTFVSEVIIIEGVVMDAQSKTTFYGPIQLPRTVNSILLPEHPEWDYQTVYQTQILLIPSETVDILTIQDPSSGVFIGKVQQKRQRGGLKFGKTTAFRDSTESEYVIRDSVVGIPQEVHERKVKVGFRSSSSSLIEEKSKKNR